MNLPDDWLEQLRTNYPRRNGAQGWAALKRLVPRAIAEGSTFDELLTGAKAYKLYNDRIGKTGTEFVKTAEVFFGRGEWWKEYAEMATSERADNLKTRARALGFGKVSEELMLDLDALEAKLTGIAKQREAADKAREISTRKLDISELAARVRV